MQFYCIDCIFPSPLWCVKSVFILDQMMIVCQFVHLSVILSIFDYFCIKSSKIHVLTSFQHNYNGIHVSFISFIWLVVLTILKNISQWEGLSHIWWKIKVMFETTNQSWTKAILRTYSGFLPIGSNIGIQNLYNLIWTQNAIHHLYLSPKLHPRGTHHGENMGCGFSVRWSSIHFQAFRLQTA